MKSAPLLKAEPRKQFQRQSPNSTDNLSRTLPLSDNQTESESLTSFQARQEKGVVVTNGLTDLGLSHSADKNVISPLPTNTVTLATLPDAAELPAQRTTDTTLPSNQAQADSLFEVGPAPGQGLTIAIDQPAVMAVSGISFDVTSDPAKNPGPAWEVRLRSVAQQGGDKEKSSLDNIAAGLDEIRQVPKSNATASEA